MVFSLLYLNGTLSESRWIFSELLKSALSGSLPTSSSGTLNIRDRRMRAPSIGFSPIAFTCHVKGTTVTATTPDSTGRVCRLCRHWAQRQ
jgi:hypothetical protein